MGDNIIDDGDLVVEVAGETTDSDTGQLILTDVTLSLDRDNTNIHGISNKEPQAMAYGNETYELSFEGHVNDSIASIITEMYTKNKTTEGSITTDDGSIEANIGKIDWNSVEKSASDGGDVTLSLDADCRQVDLA